ncbi:MAG TPA: phospho-N-acetylmuramoyl-pentapeptide-transferase [Ignavibacteria bacterium]|nr:phospho-N-acetylmuramoyl-pentapeptide-transferase [Ignavibacteria bacterium]HMR39457.1 phospho-N-acetylmuramoyl-pentapeptide-transferase [Ignavibacteria bacterium]
MLYKLAEYINSNFNPPGFDIFKFITFRSALAAITALLISFILGPKIIKILQRKQIGEARKEDGPQFHWSKAGTPTMGGFIILFSVLIPVLLWGDLGNIYVIIILFVTIALGAVGFTDDYLKVVKKYKKGLAERYKLLGQLTVGLIVGCAIYFLPQFDGIHSVTTIPFLKGVEFDFSIFYIPIVVFIITATSNAVNFTDGLDGLAVGTVGVVALTIGIIAYVSGNIETSKYLNIIYLRGNGELAIYCSALVGAALGFLWYNFYPAQVFMGDTGSLALGGAIGTLCVLVKKEFMLPVLGGIFFVEALSVIVQRYYFKYTRKRFGEGKRIFKMAPIHHHFEMKGIPEPKIVVRFYIVAVILAIITLASLKIR